MSMRMAQGEGLPPTTLGALPVLLLALLPHVHAAPAAAAEPPTVMLVLDGSGSMWGKPEGERQAKLYMARDALRAALAKAPNKSARVGLASFGHRRSGDCGDAEVILKPEALSPERLMPPVEKLNPRGRGPITAALREVAKELGPQSAPSTVILVHDDLDNCQIDPCSAIGDLRRAHPRVAVHVISLAMRKDDAQRMACLPKATNGRHFEVATQVQLNQALDEAFRLAAVAAPRASPERPAPAAPAAERPADPRAPGDRPGVQLSVSLMPGGDPLDLPVRWRVTRAGDQSGAALWEGDAAAPLLELPTGRYDVEAWLGFVKARSTVEAVAGQRRALVLPLGAGTVRFGAAGTAQPATVRDAVVVFRKVDTGATEHLAIQRGVATEVAVAAGSYIVSVTVGSLRFDRGVILRPGDRQMFQPALAFGEIELTALAAAGGQPVEDALFTLYEDDPDAPQGRREIARSSAGRPRFALPAGTYYAVARLGTAEARERISVRAGETESRALVLDVARLLLVTRLPGGRIDLNEAISHRLERIGGGEPREVVHASRAASALQLAAGRYKLETRIGLGNVRFEREIEIRAGAREQVNIEPPAGYLVLRLLDGSGGAALTDVAWDIRDAQGRTVWVGNQTEARPLLLAGRYAVSATTRGRRSERTIDLRPGEVRSTDLVPQ
jgi:Ca-activated chloride channel family protein